MDSLADLGIVAEGAGVERLVAGHHTHHLLGPHLEAATARATTMW